jgi:UDP-glucuronate decarboxylase
VGKKFVHTLSDWSGRDALRRAGVSKTVAVIGGAGFLGSHLCERLLGLGDTVWCLDDFSTGRLGNVAHLFQTGRLLVREHDILARLPADLPRFDEIYNLACPASPGRYQAQPIRTAMICAQGVLHCLERAAADGARLFHASTSEIYGDPELHPQPEAYFGNVNPTGPRSCYDEGKRFAETLISDFTRQGGVTARIARIFNTYGPRMQPDDGRVVSNFVVQALRDEDITVYGAGGQTRSFCFVDDLIEGIVRLTRTDAAVDGPVNLGNPAEIEVRELARLVIDMTGSTSRIVHRPLPADDPRRRRPDITRALELLGWAPTTPLREGLQRTIDHFAAVLVQTGGVSRPLAAGGTLAGLAP